MRSSRLHPVIVVAFGFLALHARAADVALGTSPEGGTYRVFNPHAGDGLVPVASAANDVSFAESYPTTCWGQSADVTESDSMAAAAYGSDVSIDGDVHPALVGTGVEPMVEASVSSIISRSSSCPQEIARVPGVDPPWLQGLGSAYASGNILHRVVARPFPPELAPILEPLREIPVRIEYALSATAEGNATARALFRLSLNGDELVSRDIRQGDPELQGSLSTTLLRTTATEVYDYNIFVYTSSAAAPEIYQPSGVASAEAQAVVDPFIRVDPTWPYAQYFAVEQESVATPGEWAEVTRNWQPDPDADGIPSSLDNCTLAANADQRDTDADGYGNLCDGDLNNSGGLVNFADLAIFRTTFGTSNPDADLNGSGGIVNFADLAIFRTLFGKAPGPSGAHP